MLSELHIRASGHFIQFHSSVNFPLLLVFAFWHAELGNEETISAVKDSESTKRLKTSTAQESKGLVINMDAQLLRQKTDNLNATESDWSKKLKTCPVYHPSEVEFEDPFVYLQKIASEASKYGICKVVCPLDSSVPAGAVMMKERTNFKFLAQLQPLRLAKWDRDDKIAFSIGTKKYTIREFEKMADKTTSRKYSISACLPASFVEKEFWSAITEGKPGRTVEYGINIEGSAFSSVSNEDPLRDSKWNLKKLALLPTSMLHLLENLIPGLTDPMLYIGMLFSMFAWHVEDHYLYSINYHHCGAPKTWYGVPGEAALAFEKVVQQHVYKPEILTREGEDGAFDILAGKTTLFPPGILLQHDVPVFKTVQMPGDFIITFPKAYHAGFSHGFNCCEAVNFATSDWIPFGAAACHRYALLERMPIIPYEQLVCQKAMLLAEPSNQESVSSTNCVKSSFASLLRFYHCACWCLKKLKTSLRIFPKSQAAACFLCKRECYLAQLVCSCCLDPICLFHENETYNCKCESNGSLYLHEDILKFIAIARQFEDDDTIHHEVEQQMKSDAYSWIQNILVSIQENYVPYED